MPATITVFSIGSLSRSEREASAISIARTTPKSPQPGHHLKS